MQSLSVGAKEIIIKYLVNMSDERFITDLKVVCSHIQNFEDLFLLVETAYYWTGYAYVEDTQIRYYGT
jgi:hypothetical protein